METLVTCGVALGCFVEPLCTLIRRMRLTLVASIPALSLNHRFVIKELAEILLVVLRELRSRCTSARGNLLDCTRPQEALHESHVT